MRDGWRTATLCEIGVLIRGRGITKADLVDEGGVPCLRYGEIYTTYGYTTETLAACAREEAAAGGTSLQYGDIVFAASGETAAEIGSAVGWLGSSPAVVGGDTIILRDHGQDTVFLSHALNSAPVVRQKVRLGKGQAVVHIHVSDLARVAVSLPPIEEQKRIAEILRTWDRAIDGLQRLVLETRQQKRSLMQMLLAEGRRGPDHRTVSENDSS